MTLSQRHAERECSDDNELPRPVDELEIAPSLTRIIPPCHVQNDFQEAESARKASGTPPRDSPEGEMHSPITTESDKPKKSPGKVDGDGRKNRRQRPSWQKKESLTYEIDNGRRMGYMRRRGRGLIDSASILSAKSHEEMLILIGDQGYFFDDEGYRSTISDSKLLYAVRETR